MRVDGQDLRGETLTASVCVVGTGPAGLAVASRLAGTGVDVVLLERGGTATAAYDPAGENADRAYYRLDRTRATGLGGTAGLWRAATGMRTRPLSELDLRPRADVDRPGWPEAAMDLRGYWQAAAGFLALGHVGEPLPSGADLVAGSDVAETSVFAVGDASAVMEHAFVLAGEGSPVRVVTDAEALAVADGDPAVVEVAVGSGRLRVEARAVVVAAGAIETARLLLLSTSDRHPDGLGNDAGLVGRYFSEHPHLRTGVLEPSVAPGALAAYLWREGGDADRLGSLRLTDEVLVRERLLTSTWELLPLGPGQETPTGRALTELVDTRRSFGRAVPGTPRRAARVMAHPVDAGRAALGVVRRRRSAGPEVVGAGHFALMAMTEPASNPDARVTLGTAKDAHGRPVARLRWARLPEDERTVARTQELLGDELERLGVGRVVARYGSGGPELWGGGFHHLGTTRMAASPDDGVVDADARVFGTDAVFVAGGATFPSVGFANPTLAVVAQSLRLADHLASILGTGVGA